MILRIQVAPKFVETTGGKERYVYIPPCLETRWRGARRSVRLRRAARLGEICAFINQCQPGTHETSRSHPNLSLVVQVTARLEPHALFLRTCCRGARQPVRFH